MWLDSSQVVETELSEQPSSHFQLDMCDRVQLFIGKLAAASFSLLKRLYSDEGREGKC